MSTKSQNLLSNPGNKIEVDLLIKGGHLLTMDEDRREYTPGFIAIEGKKIVDVGKYNEGMFRFKGKVEIDATGCLILPGFINTHTHAAMTLFRGYADDLPLREWLFNHIFPAEGKFVNDYTVYWGTKLAIAEMLRNGITTFSDGYFYTASVARAVKESGIRAVVGQGVLDYPTPDTPDPASNYSRAELFMERFEGFSDRVYPSIFCHSPYTCSERTLIRMKNLCNAYNALFQIHLSETEQEVVEFKEKHATRPSIYLQGLGILDDLTLVAHAVWLDDEEVSVLKNSGVGVSHVISSNMKLATGVAPLKRFLAARMKVGIGTDGCASNNRLDLLRDIDLAAKLHKLWWDDPTAAPAFSLVEMVTKQGAKAIGVDEKLGSIETGKLADLVILTLHKPHLTPVYDPYSHIVYCARGTDVRDVIVDGKVVVRNGKIESFDETEVIRKVEEISNKIRKNRLGQEN